MDFGLEKSEDDPPGNEGARTPRWEDLIQKRLKERYYVEAFLGRGGMATVYKGRVLKDCIVYKGRVLKEGEIVAIKVLLPYYADDPKYVARFRLEAKNASKVEHDKVVQVYDSSRDGNYLYIIMEYVDGSSLDRYVHSQSSWIPLEDAKKIVIQALQGLEAVHEHCIHRDLKWQNILITRDGRVKLSDFGIAKSEEDPNLTETGIVLGTPSYTAPELFQAKKATRQSDLYAMGVVLFELCTGRLPFHGEGDTPIARYYDLANKHINVEPPRPSDLNPLISRDLENLILKALAKDVEARFANARDMITQLSSIRWSTNKPSTAMAASSDNRLDRFPWAKGILNIVRGRREAYYEISNNEVAEEHADSPAKERPGRPRKYIAYQGPGYEQPSDVTPDNELDSASARGHWSSMSADSALSAAPGQGNEQGKEASNSGEQGAGRTGSAGNAQQAQAEGGPSSARLAAPKSQRIMVPRVMPHAASEAQQVKEQPAPGTAGPKPAVVRAGGDWDARRASQQAGQGLGEAGANRSAQAASHSEPGGPTSGSPRTKRLIANRYQTESILYAGEDTTIYLARDVKYKPPRVNGEYQDSAEYMVIKILNDSHKRNARAVEALRREIEFALGVRMDGFAGPSAEQDHEDCPFMVMPYITGTTLAAKTWDDPLMAYKAAYNFATRVEQFHTSTNLAHGMLTLSNTVTSLFDSSSGMQPIVYLLDLGYVHEIDPVTGEPAGIAQCNKQEIELLTWLYVKKRRELPYLAPERWSTEFPGFLPSRRSDVFSLGVGMYHIFTGRLPYSLEPNEAPDVLQEQMLRRNYKPISYYEPGRPDSIQELIDTCLQPDPQDRYDSVYQLLADMVRMYDAHEQNYTQELQIPKQSKAKQHGRATPDGPRTQPKQRSQARRTSQAPPPAPSPQPLPSLQVELPAGGLAIGRIGRSSAPVTHKVKVVCNSSAGGRIESSATAEGWLTIEPARIAPNSETEVTVTLKPDRLPTGVRGEVGADLHFYETGHSAPIVARVRLEVVVGTVVCLLLDVVGDKPTIEARLKLAEEILNEAERKLGMYGNLSFVIGAFWDRNHSKTLREEAPPLFLSEPSGKASALSLLRTKVPTLIKDGLEYDYETCLEEALTHLNALQLTNSTWNVLVTMTGRPPHPLTPLPGFQVRAPSGLDWELALSDLARRIHLLSVCVPCPIYWPGPRASTPKHASSYSSYVWEKLGYTGSVPFSTDAAPDVVEAIASSLA